MNVREYIPFQTAGSTQGKLYTAVHNNHDGSNVPDAIQWQWIPRFNGSVYHYQVQYGGEHKGVNIQKATTADLHEGDDIVYQHMYKKCQWKGVDLWTEGDTVQPAHSESSLDSDADCVLVASTVKQNVQALSQKAWNGKLESGRWRNLKNFQSSTQKRWVYLHVYRFLKYFFKSNSGLVGSS